MLTVSTAILDAIFRPDQGSHPPSTVIVLWIL